MTIILKNYISKFLERRYVGILSECQDDSTNKSHLEALGIVLMLRVVIKNSLQKKDDIKRLIKLLESLRIFVKESVV